MGCQSTSQDSSARIKLASVYDKDLFLDEIQGKLYNKTSQDSISLQAMYVDKWITEQLIFHEAQTTLGNDSEIVTLVDKYKTSLYSHKLEQRYIKENLDTTITQSELDTFRTRHEEEFKLQEGVVRFLLVKASIDNYNDTIKTLWKTEDLPGLRSYITQKNGLYQLDIDLWHYYSELKAICPKGLTDKINLKKTDSYSYKNGEEFYLLKILEYRGKKEKAPLSFIKESITRRILFERSRELLKAWKQNMFKENIKSKHIYIRH